MVEVRCPGRKRTPRGEVSCRDMFGEVPAAWKPQVSLAIDRVEGDHEVKRCGVCRRWVVIEYKGLVALTS